MNLLKPPSLAIKNRLTSEKRPTLHAFKAKSAVLERNRNYGIPPALIFDHGKEGPIVILPQSGQKSSNKITKCHICQKIEAIPYQCHYCGIVFCGHHHLPENHECDGLPCRPPFNVGIGYSSGSIYVMPKYDYHTKKGTRKVGSSKY